MFCVCWKLLCKEMETWVLFVKFSLALIITFMHMIREEYNVGQCRRASVAE